MHLFTDSPSRTTWDDDDFTPPMKSSWDLPTPLRSDMEREEWSERGGSSRGQRSSRDRDFDRASNRDKSVRQYLLCLHLMLCLCLILWLLIMMHCMALVQCSICSGSCVCVDFTMLCMKMINFGIACMFVYYYIYHWFLYGYLHVACFSLSRKALWGSESAV